MKGTIQKRNCGVGGLVKPIRKSRSEDCQAFNCTAYKLSGEMDRLPITILLPQGVGTKGEDTGMPVGNGIERGFLTLARAKEIKI